MKSLIIPCLLFSVLLFAQETPKQKYFRHFKINGMIGSTRPLLNDIQKGRIISIEPNYVIRNRWQLGIRWEHANIGTYHEFRYLSSMAVTAEWFANKNRLRPFFGVGLGSFKTSLVQEGTSTWHWYTPGGITWRTGLEYWHIRTSVEANILSKGSGFVFDYLGLKVGGNISFGKKRSD